MEYTGGASGVYIDPRTMKLLRVVETSELHNHPGDWKLLLDDPDQGLLASRAEAVRQGYSEDGRDIEWYRYSHADDRDEDQAVLDEVSKANARAQAEAVAEEERNSVRLAR
ncbi:MAG: hypothetical protein GEU28_03060 [Dehalococcoidia bacterium]|nr:hypothetical protein [Dehalococcoidia bacterium]